MSRAPGLVALTRRRFATPRSAALVIVALAALTAFLLSAAPRALVGVVRAEVAYQISEIPVSGRDLTGSMLVPPDFGPAEDEDLVAEWDDGADSVFGALADHLAAYRADFADSLHSLTAPAELFARTEAIAAVPEELSPTAPNSNVQLLADPELRSTMRLLDGSWPTPWDGAASIPLVLSATGAERMDWPVGQTRHLQSQFGLQPGTDLTVVLTGTVEAVDAGADRWQHLPATALTATIFDDGNRRPEATGAGFVDVRSWPAIDASLRSGQIATTAWYPVDAAAASSEEPGDLYAALSRATAESVPMNDSGTARMRFSSTVVDVLETSLARSNSAAAILAIAAVGPLAVSVALTVLASTLIIRRRRADLTLMSARGAPLSRLRRLLAGEGLVLGLPAAVAGILVGTAVTRFDAGPLPVLGAALAGLIPAATMALALRPSTLTGGRADLDAPVRGRSRGAAEGAIVVLATVAVALLLVRGVGSATEGIDPLVIAAPLLVTVALALVVVRLHPVPIAVWLRGAGRRRGVVGLVGAARSLREPGAGSTAVLAMLVAVAIAVFSSVTLATVDQGAETAAQRQVGADMQVSGPFFDSAQLDAIRTISGVADASGVLIGDRVTVEGRGAHPTVVVLAAETARLAEVQAAFPGGIPVDAVTPATDPVSAVASSAVTAQVGEAGETARTDLAFAVDLPRILGVSTSDDFILVDAEDYRAVTGLGFFPRSVFLSLADGADPGAVSTEIQRLIGAPHATELLSDRTAEIQASPAITALRLALFTALSLAVALSIVAMLLVAGVSRDARSRTIALLRTIGLGSRGARGVVAWEFVPLGITSLVGGVLLGALLPLLVLSAVDLRPFTGGTTQPALSTDPLLTGALIASVVVALAFAVVGGVLSARTTSIATVLRTEED